MLAQPSARAGVRGCSVNSLNSSAAAATPDHPIAVTTGRGPLTLAGRRDVPVPKRGMCAFLKGFNVLIASAGEAVDVACGSEMLFRNRLAAAGDLCGQGFRVRLGQRRDQAEATAVGHGRGELGDADPLHAALDDRVRDAKDVGESGGQHRARTPLLA